MGGVVVLVTWRCTRQVRGAAPLFHGYVIHKGGYAGDLEMVLNRYVLPVMSGMKIQTATTIY